MLNKVTITLVILIGVIGALVNTSCSSTPSPAPTQTVTHVLSPTNIPTAIPEPTEIVVSTAIPESCPWIAYFFDGEIELSSQNGDCLRGERGIHVSDDLKNISFFLSRSSDIGTYGVCRNISSEDEFKFRISIHDKTVSSRFLVMVSPEPKPTQKHSVGFRIQPELMDKNEKGMWVKLLEYRLDGFDTDKGGIPAAKDWMLRDNWNFDFVIQFSGSQGYFSMNKKALSRTWPINFSERYLCFAYQLMPTASNASELEVVVDFP